MRSTVTGSQLRRFVRRHLVRPNSVVPPSDLLRFRRGRRGGAPGRNNPGLLRPRLLRLPLLLLLRDRIAPPELPAGPPSLNLGRRPRRLSRGSPRVLPFRQPPRPSSTSPVGGRLQTFFHEWAAITSDEWALSVVKHGLFLEFVGQPPLSRTPLHLSSDLAHQ